MLLYAYFAKQRRRKEQDFEALQNASQQQNTTNSPVSDPTESPDEKTPDPGAEEDGVQSPSTTLSPTRTAAVTHLDSHMSQASSATSTHYHTEHPDIEHRSRHRYTIRRPRALQYSYHRKFIAIGDEAGYLQGPDHHGEHGHAEKSDISSHLPEAVARQRERTDLFIDLIWVGIIGNLSEVYSELAFSPESPQPGLGILVFMLVFLPSWRIWNSMREFLNNYYMEDMLQRFFIFWILILSVFFGNQLAYLAEDIDGVKVWVISVYLIIHSSFMMIEEVYSIFIPWLRKLVLVQLLVKMPGVGLWVVAIYLPGFKAVGPIAAAIMWEYLVPMLLDSPLAERFTPGGYQKALDVNHFTSRMANFFIIVLGEGVLQLVKDGPLGRGLNGVTGEMAWILAIYFAFSYLYFARDGSKAYMPAVRHKGWKFMIWVFWHIPLFSALLTFVAAVMFIIRHQDEQNYQLQHDQKDLTPDQVQHFTYSAVWTCASSLAIVVFTTLVLSILDRPLDKPGTLKIDNRYLRLAGRPLYVIVIMCVTIRKDIDPLTFLAIAGMGLMLVTMWEWNSSLEKNGGFIEPKGLTLRMSHEFRGKKPVAIAQAVAHGDVEDHHHRRVFHIPNPVARA